MPNWKKATEKSRASQRRRNYATIVYPESAPSDWLEILEKEHVPVYISPLHDMDKNATGEPKKAHYHVVLMYAGPKDKDSQVKPLIDKIGGVGCEIIKDLRGYARYLCHLDNPEKHQYSPADVKTICCPAEYLTVIQTAADTADTLDEILDFVRCEGIYSFAELVDVTRNMKDKKPEWRDVVMKKESYLIKSYMQSMQWELQHEYTLAWDRKDGQRPLPAAMPPSRIRGEDRGIGALIRNLKNAPKNESK